MKIPTIQQYKEAIPALYRKQKEVLEALYSFPNSSATAEELAKIIYPSKPSLIIASGRIGRAGKRIADLCNIVPNVIDVNDSKKEIYAHIISCPYKRNVGWTMHKNLKTALEELNLVTRK